MSQDTNALQCLSHDLGPIVDSQDDILDTGLSQCLNLMLDHGLVRELDQRLRVCEGEWPQTGAEASYENNGFHVGGVVVLCRASLVFCGEILAKSEGLLRRNVG